MCPAQLKLQISSKKIRDLNDKVAIIATGGKSDDSIVAAIDAGANAISYTPPSTGELFKEIMEKYRAEENA